MQNNFGGGASLYNFANTSNYYRVNPFRRNNETTAFNSFSDQINIFNKVMESLVVNKDSVASKKNIFENALTKLLFFWNLDTDANRVLLFRLMVSFFKYKKKFLDPQWLAPLLDRIEAKNALSTFTRDNQLEMLNLSQRLRSEISSSKTRVNVAGNAAFWIGKVRKNRRSRKDSLQWTEEYFGRTMIAKEKLKLVDPFSRCRIANPVRGENCSHLQIFDMETYVQRWYRTQAKNAQGRLWLCPICEQETHPRQLYVDLYMKELIERNSEKDEVMLDESGKIIDESNAKKFIEVLSDGESELVSSGGSNQIASNSSEKISNKTVPSKNNVTNSSTRISATRSCLGKNNFSVGMRLRSPLPSVSQTLSSRSSRDPRAKRLRLDKNVYFVDNESTQKGPLRSVSPISTASARSQMFSTSSFPPIPLQSAHNSNRQFRVNTLKTNLSTPISEEGINYQRISSLDSNNERSKIPSSKIQAPPPPPFQEMCEDDPDVMIISKPTRIYSAKNVGSVGKKAIVNQDLGIKQKKRLKRKKKFL